MSKERQWQPARDVQLMSRGSDVLAHQNSLQEAILHVQTEAVLSFYKQSGMSSLCHVVLMSLLVKTACRRLLIMFKQKQR